MLGRSGAQDGICSAIHVFIHTNPFREQDLQNTSSIVISLPNASADTRLLVRPALFGLKKIYKPGHAYKKLDRSSGLWYQHWLKVYGTTLFSSASIIIPATLKPV
jgi:hypothetical protein